MKFVFCGNSDLPDWVVAQISTITRLSSIKLGMLVKLVSEGILKPPINMERVAKLFTDSNLGNDVDLKACVAGLSFIIMSSVRFRSDHSVLLSEYQQLGLPREHSMAIRKITADQSAEITEQLERMSLKVDNLDEFTVSSNPEHHAVIIDFSISEKRDVVTLTMFTIGVMLEQLRGALSVMEELKDDAE